MAGIFTLGIAGLGTVGTEVIRILLERAEALAQQSGQSIEIGVVSARDKSKSRKVDISGYKWEADPLSLLGYSNIQCIVELIGGADGVAYQLVKGALGCGKHVVTANKALMAKHGKELAELAEKNNVGLLFEAAVAGGIPVINVLKHGLAANRIRRVAGILNGTCNYILTEMSQGGRQFQDVLLEAQEKGYAEAEPSFDVDGIDTAHKLALLSALAFTCPPDMESVYVEGIRQISPADITYARELGYQIKLLGLTSCSENGIQQYVYPCLLAEEAGLAQVGGVLNAVYIEGDAVGSLMLQGPGAGGGATASAVVADLVELASGRKSNVFNQPVNHLKPLKSMPIAQRKGEYYVRLKVKDVPGVLAKITQIVSKQDVGIEQLLQPHPHKDGSADIIFTTHEASEKSMQLVLEKLEFYDAVLEKPHRLRIEKL